MLGSYWHPKQTKIFALVGLAVSWVWGRAQTSVRRTAEFSGRPKATGYGESGKKQHRGKAEDWGVGLSEAERSDLLKGRDFTKIWQK